MCVFRSDFPEECGLKRFGFSLLEYGSTREWLAGSEVGVLGAAGKGSVCGVGERVIVAIEDAALVYRQMRLIQGYPVHFRPVSMCDLSAQYPCEDQSGGSFEPRRDSHILSPFARMLRLREGSATWCSSTLWKGSTNLFYVACWSFPVCPSRIWILLLTASALCGGCMSQCSVSVVFVVTTRAWFGFCTAAERESQRRRRLGRNQSLEASVARLASGLWLCKCFVE